jgi:hypothetical protein
MFAANEYPIRPATSGEADALAQLDSSRRLTGDVIVAEIDGRPAAAISLYDGRTVADPFQRTTRAVQALRLRAASTHAAQRTPSARERLRAGVRIRRPAAA